jgi:hypothetical protein
MSFDHLHAAQLRPATTPEAQAEVFKRGVRMVEIEVFSYCNRKCWFCPNATFDRTGENQLMPPALYSGILDELAGIDYDGMITYSRYNEPLADEVIIDRISLAHRRLPKARLHTNTNGDYLTLPYLERLYDAGLRSLNIQLYLGNNDLYDHQATQARGRQTLRRVPLPATVVRDEPGEWFEQRLEFRDMAIRMYGRNFSHNGTSRGDQVNIHRRYVRTAPCLMPFWSVYVDFNGAVVPCCNFRSDIAPHKDYVLGDLSKGDTLFSVYASAAAASFRASLLDEQVKGGLCRNCHFALEPVNDDQRALMARLHAEAAVAPGANGQAR